MTKENILNVATNEFTIYGYDAVSMNKLAAKLEVNKATIYYHFKDKQSLYQEVIKHLIISNQENIQNVLSSSLEPKEKFKAYIKEYIQAIKNKPQIVALSLREMANYGANVDEQIVPYIEQEIEYLRLAIVELPLKENYKSLDMYLLKSLVLGTINNYYAFQMSKFDFQGLSQFNKNSGEILDFTNDFLVDFILDAICED
ncbi:MAG: TetR/AcrR family transcriptional regulator [Arcobacteraceae bacterium]|nr:TetR/AcrR family transcriptional regulator [Arcobacteraceae bacterium]